MKLRVMPQHFNIADAALRNLSDSALLPDCDADSVLHILFCRLQQFVEQTAKLLRRDRFEQIPNGMHLISLDRKRPVRRQKGDRKIFVFLPDRARKFHAVHLPHRDIQENDII